MYWQAPSVNLIHRLHVVEQRSVKVGPRVTPRGRKTRKFRYLPGFKAAVKEFRNGQHAPRCRVLSKSYLSGISEFNTAHATYRDGLALLVGFASEFVSHSNEFFDHVLLPNT